MKLGNRINKCNNMKELNKLRLLIVNDIEDFDENQKLFVKRKNKIKRNGGDLNGQ